MSEFINQIVMLILIAPVLVGWYAAIDALYRNYGGPEGGTKKAIGILRGLGIVGCFLTPFCLGAGAMGLAREGHKGAFFFIEQAFYFSTMGFPLMFLPSTRLSAFLANRNRMDLALLSQATPILVPSILFALVIVTA